MEAFHQIDEIVGDRYQIKDVLGQGGMGTTYAAIDLQTQQPVALKALELRRMTDWKVLELFEREAKVLSYLQHPAIPRYLDYFQVDTLNDCSFYLVQELAQGRSLAALVQAGYRFEETEVQKIAAQVLEVLRYLHALKPPVIHRDLKPQNLIRREDGQLFVVDFGAVQDTYRDTLMYGSTIVGTYGYMAPEQLQGKAYPATDFYGLAATLLFLLTHESPADLPQRRLKIDFRSRLELSPAFADWLDSMIAPAVEDRFTSANNALFALKQAAKGSQLSRSPFQPVGSRIVLERTPHRLDLSIPPGGVLKTESNMAKAGLVIYLLFFLLIWVGTAISVEALWPLIAFCLFLTPVWVFGVRWLWSGLSPLVVTTHLHIDQHSFHLYQQILGWRYRQASGDTHQLHEIKLTEKSQTNQEPLIVCCELTEGTFTHKFGNGLTLVEKRWLVREISAFLNKINESV
jgi:serine/threonine protein kinase